MKKRDARKTILMDHLLQQGRLSTQDVITFLGISLSSVRRLLIELEEEGKLLRVHGGVQVKNLTGAPYVFSEFKEQNPVEKKLIGQYAAENLVSSGDVLYLDSGTTVFQFALALKRCLQDSQVHDIRVVTNSLPNMEVLHDVADVTMIGGRFRDMRRDFAGYATERFLRFFNYQKAFLGADGFDISSGFLGKDTDTARINEVIIKRSSDVYILMDSSKFRHQSFVSYADLDSVKAVITDASIDTDIRQKCEEKALSIIVAKPRLVR